MDVSCLVSRQIPNLSGAGIDTRSSKPLFSGDVNCPSQNASGASLRTRRFVGIKKEKEIKKKLLLKGMAEDLAAEFQGNVISERAEALLRQLEQVRAVEEEFKKKMKEEKAKIKAELMKTMTEDFQSSLSIMFSGDMFSDMTSYEGDTGGDIEVGDIAAGIGLDLMALIGGSRE